MQVIKFIDLFAGTGGIRLAFEEAIRSFNIEPICVKSAEIDKRACETYEYNFGENPYCDVRELTEIPPFDALLAGFPCQSFSYAGKQLGFADTRGTLFFEIERILKKNKPRFCFLENVRGLTSHDNGRTLKTILDRLNNLGYYTKYWLLNSSNHGVPQNRVRIYIIASLIPINNIGVESSVGASDSHSYKRNTQNSDLFMEDRMPLVRDILEGNPDKKYDCSQEFINSLRKVLNGKLENIHGIRLIDTRHGNSIHSWDIGIKGECSQSEINFMNLLISNRRRNVFGTHQDGKALTIEQISTFYNQSDTKSILSSLIKKGYLRENDGKYNPVCGNMSFEVFKFLDPESISITLTASDTNKLGIYHNGRIRRLTPRECARLQGYPDSYTPHPIDSFAYKQIGNAVSVPVIHHLLSKYFEKNPKIFEADIELKTISNSFIKDISNNHSSDAREDNKYKHYI